MNKRKLLSKFQEVFFFDRIDDEFMYSKKNGQRARDVPSYSAYDRRSHSDVSQTPAPLCLPVSATHTRTSSSAAADKIVKKRDDYPKLRHFKTVLKQE